MSDAFDTRTPGETTGGSVADIKPTTGDIRLVMQTIGALGAKIDRLITDRKDDKDEITRKIDEVRIDLRERIDGAKADLTTKISEAKTDLRERIEATRTDHKDFIEKDFRPLREDVSKLRLKWAYMAGVAAVVGIIASFLLDLLKSHLH